MKSFSFFIRSLLLLSFFSLLSCDEIEFKDGRIPQEYLTQAKALTGTYKGSFFGKKGDLNLSLQGHLAVLTYRSENGNDLIGIECQSRIGRLKKGIIKDNNRIEQLIFSFNPGQCNIRGRELDLEFSKDYKRITLYLQDYEYLEQQCEWVQHNPPAPPVFECRNVIRKHYTTGTFVR